MTSTFRVLALVAVCGAVISGSIDHAAAQSKRKSEEVQVEPFALPPGTETVPIAFERMAYRLPRNHVAGRNGSGLGCIQSTPIIFDGGRGEFDPALFQDEFRRVMDAANVDLAGDPNALFRDRDAERANLVVGAIMTDLNWDVCTIKLPLVGNTESSDAAVSIEWQVYSAREQRVVYTTRTGGRGKGKSRAGGATDAIYVAFGAATEDLMRDQGFVSLLTRVSTGNAVAEMTPSDATTIARQPLRSGRFQDAVTLTRAQVATLSTASGMGSGFYISDNLLLTNEHVVGGASIVVVRLVTGREVVGEVLATNSARDVALVRTEPHGLAGLPVNLQEPGVGSQVFVIGTPLDQSMENTVSAGIVSAYRNEDGVRYMQSDTNVQPGNSGGPMFDENGNVVAITVAGFGGRNSGLNLFIPIAEAFAALNIQVSGGQASR